MIVGIDLGTTNSLVACVVDGKPRVLESRDGRHLVPSVVSFTSQGILIGDRAKALKVRDAGNTVFSVKRLLGRGFEDLRDSARSLPYEIVAGGEGGEGGDDGENGEGAVARIRAGDRTYTAVEISGMILKELKLQAEAALGAAVTQAVVTVPAYFNDSQRQATRLAGRLAGLDILRIVNEPTAAALAYGFDRKREGLVAVYDLGGGTFDLSILKIRDGIFEVLATHGDTALGGDDLDRVFARDVFETLARNVAGADSGAGAAQDPLSNADLKGEVLETAERAKIAFADPACSDFLFEIRKGEWKYSRRWTRAEFERGAREVLERTREPCLQALRDAGIDASELTDVLLVGGPTRLAVVQAVAREIFGREPNSSLHPDEVVAVGAAIQADILAGNNSDLLLLDVVPLSLGIETYGGLMSALIPRNTRIPAVARETFTTYADKQTGVDIHVYQGERERVADNRSLARFKLKGLEPAPAGLPRIEVTFLVDADGILQVSARDVKTGHQQAIEVRPSFGLTEGEIARMLESSAAQAPADAAYRRLVEVRNDNEPILRATERHLSAIRQHLSGDEQSLIAAKVEGLRRALAGEDPAAIQDAGFELDQSTKKLADLIVREAIKTQSERT